MQSSYMKRVFLLSLLNKFHTLLYCWQICAEYPPITSPAQLFLYQPQSSELKKLLFSLRPHQLIHCTVGIHFSCLKHTQTQAANERFQSSARPPHTCSSGSRSQLSLQSFPKAETCHLFARKWQKPNQPTTNNCASLLSLLASATSQLISQSTTATVSGEIGEGYRHILPLSLVSDKSGNEAQSLMANLPLRRLKWLPESALLLVFRPYHTAICCGLAGALQLLLLHIRKPIFCLLCP